MSANDNLHIFKWYDFPEKGMVSNKIEQMNHTLIYKFVVREWRKFQNLLIIDDRYFYLC